MLVLGRVAGADLVIRDARASRRHAELTPENGGVRIAVLAEEPAATSAPVGPQPDHHGAP